MKRTFVLGDAHGGAKAIEQCFERSDFDKKKDRLVCIGDVCDGWPEVPECFELLLEVSDLVYIMGNHCFWAYAWMTKGLTPDIWTSQGGRETIEAYKRRPGLLKKHQEILSNAKSYWVDEKNNLYVHGGISHLPIEEQSSYNLTWDRDMWFDALHRERLGIKHTDKRYNEIFIGHTTTSGITIDRPVNALNIWNVDQGGGWEGRLTLMNVDTKEFWQSDIVKTLYPNVKGR